MLLCSEIFYHQIISIKLHYKIKDQSKLIIQKWHLSLIHYLQCTSLFQRKRWSLKHNLPVAFIENETCFEELHSLGHLSVQMNTIIYKTYPEIRCLQFRYGSYKLSQNANAWITNSSIDVWSANSFSFFLLFNWEFKHKIICT